MPALTFVLGGAASGKSRLAENLAETHGATRMYLATAQVFDDEMRAKVSLHQTRRKHGWFTVEASLEAASALAGPKADLVLFDCATLWLSNQMLDEDRDLQQEQQTLLKSLRACPVPVIVVSNEVGDGIVPDNKLARQFREAQGRLNIAMAAQADLVIKVTAGLPQILKGDMP